MLHKYSKHILVVELQGQIFFGNATLLCADVQKLLESANSQIRYLLLDFTLVLGIDSSAAESLAKIHIICKKYDAKLCYSRGSRKGFPCVAPLSDRLFQLEATSHEESIKLGCKPDEAYTLHVADSLDEALRWCEDDLLLISGTGSGRSADIISESSLSVQQLHTHCPHESVEVILRLLSYFSGERVTAGTMLWRQGDASNKAVLLGKGSMISHVEGEEAKTTEALEMGFLIGELGLLTGVARRSTVVAEEDCELFVLHKERYDTMIKEEPYLGMVLSRICMVRAFDNYILTLLLPTVLHNRCTWITEYSMLRTGCGKFSLL